VVDSDVDDIDGLVSKVFKYLYVYETKQTYEKPEQVVRNNAKFAVLHVKEPSDIEIINPKFKTEDYKSVVIKVKNSQLLILPMYWRFKSTGPVDCIFLHDLFSSVYQAFAV
jgi:hypothetical protein